LKLIQLTSSRFIKLNKVFQPPNLSISYNMQEQPSLKKSNIYNREEDFPSGNYSAEITDRIHEYMQQLSNTQLMAYRIAKRHLGSSFDLIRSNGFIEWTKENK